MDAVGDDQELVRRQNLSTLVGPLVEASIPPTIYNDPTYQIEIKKRQRYFCQFKFNFNTHGGFARTCSLRLKSGTTFRKEMIFKCLDNKLLANTIFSKDGIAFDVIGNKLNLKKIFE